MSQWLSRLAVIGGLFASLALTPSVMAKKESSFPGVLLVKDDGGVFTTDGVKKAQETMRATVFHAPTNLTVFTFADVPASKQDEFDVILAIKDKKDLAAAKHKFFVAWLKELAKNDHDRGVVVLICMGKGHFIAVIADRETDAKRGFSDSKTREVQKQFVDAFREHDKKSEADAKARDVGLQHAVEYVVAELKNTSVDTSTTAPQAAHGAPAAGGGSKIGGYICMGVLVLAGMWLFIGLIRAFTGGGGGGYGGGGYGGGGGGFFSSMIGGMFGAAAGMYMYDQFFGGGSNLSAGESTSGYDVASDTGAGDFDGGS